MDIQDWQFERLSRSSVKRLREDEHLLPVASSKAPSANQKRKEDEATDNSNVAKQRTQNLTVKNKSKASRTRNVKQVTPEEKPNLVTSAVPKKKTSGRKPRVNVEAKPAVVDDNRTYLEELINISDSDVLRKLAEFARTICYSSLSDSVTEIPGNTKEERLDSDQKHDFFVEEPDDTLEIENEPNHTSTPIPPETEHAPSSNPLVPWKQPRVLQVGQTVRTTVTVTKDMPNVPVVRLDKVVNRVLEVGGRKIHQTVPATAAEHIDATTLTVGQIHQLQKQGFVLKSMNVAERDAIFSGKL
ncbi:unnamed protein product [Auanema sp. JU1783]|nr:unnamed protein product [Auanema sp. JU1783]